MYNLCKIRRMEKNGSIGGHPFDIVLKSENLNDIKDGIKKRILSGCPANDLVVMRDVEFEVLCGVKIVDEEESDDGN